MPDTASTIPPARYAQPGMADRIAAVARSHLLLTGRPLVAEGEDAVAAMWNAALAIVVHGTEPDPVFWFANRAALAAFEISLADILAMPSRLSAEPALREERARLLGRVLAHGFIEDYAGIRISARGRRFPIAGATVWNVFDAGGTRIGQAAAFTPPAHATPPPG